MVRKTHSTTLTLLILATLGAGVARAQTQRSGGGSETQKFMQQYQQLAAERGTLQADNARLKKDLDASIAELAAVKRARDAAKAGVGSAAAQIAQAKMSREGADKSLEQSKLRFNELVSRFRETAQNLKDVEIERSKLHGELAEQSRAFDLCADNNQQLFEINQQVLDRYAHSGLFTRVGASEPFTRITRTRLDNLVIETQERAEQLRVKKRDAAAAAAGTASQGLKSNAGKTPIAPQ